MTTTPIPISSETIEVRDEDRWTLHRTRVFSASTDLHYLMRFLRDCRSTGTLFIDLNQGAIGSLRFQEQMNITSGAPPENSP